MKIVIFTSSTSSSGGSRQAMYQALGLHTLGHDVSFCVPEDSSLWQREPQDFWVKLPKNSKEWHKHIEPLLFSTTKGATEDATEDVIVHAFHNKALKLASWWGLGWRIRKIFNVRSVRNVGNVRCVAHRGIITPPNNPFPYLSPGLAAVIPNSQACADTLWCCPKRKIHVVGNGIPDGRIQPSKDAASVRAELGIPDNAFIFGFIGNNNILKGADTLFKAFAQKHSKESYLLTVGLSPEKWQSFIDASDCGANIRMIPHTPEVANYLQLFSTFVFPSRGLDSAPNTVLEAMKAGMPILACKTGGVGEIVQGNGMLVEKDTPKEMANAMDFMESHPEQIAEWKATSLILSAHYTVQARCTKLVELYNKLLKKYY